MGSGYKDGVGTTIPMEWRWILRGMSMSLILAITGYGRLGCPEWKDLPFPKTKNFGRAR